jgi:spermidine synthase
MKSRLTYFSLLFLFLFSGLVSLIYEIAWARQLQNIFGSETFSITIILTSFFGGMAIGSMVIARWGRERDPISLYGVLEIAIGIYTLLFPVFLEFTRHAYLSTTAAFYNIPFTGGFFKAAISFLILLVPCTLMGATLPLLSRYAGRQDLFTGKSVGLLYGMNTFGAVAGTFFSGFWMIGALGLSATVRTAAIVNLVIGFCALALSRLRSGEPYITVRAEDRAKPKDNLARFILWIYGISGFCALALEVFWTRAIMQVFNGSTYAFSSILIVFLAGSAIGSLVASVNVHRTSSPALWLALGQIAIGTLVFITLFIIPAEFVTYSWLTKALPPTWTARSLSILITSGILVFVPALFIGALFPLVVQMVSPSPADTGFEVSRIYAANTAGSILGSFCAGFFLIPVLGVRNSLVIIALTEVIIGLLLFLKVAKSPAWWKLAIIGLFLVAAVAGFRTIPANLFNANAPKGYQRMFHKEDATADVSVYTGGFNEVPAKVIRVNNYEVTIETQGYGMCLLKREGHLPCLLHPQPDSVLVIGLGSGITLSSAASHGCRHVDCIEIVPAQKDAINCFTAENGDIASDPRVNIITADGRSFVESTKNRYDVIIGDLFNASAAGTGNLFAVDHFEACRRRLKPGGIMVQWLRPTQMFENGFKTAIRSMAAVFPNVELWTGYIDPYNCLVGVVASLEPLKVDLKELQARIDHRNSALLASCGYEDALFLASQRQMDNAQIRTYAGAGECNTYDRPLIEFMVPKQMDTKGQMELLKSLLNTNPLIDNATEEEMQKLAMWKDVATWNLGAQTYIAANHWIDAENILGSLYQQLPRQPDTKFLLSQVECRLASEDLVRGNPSSTLVRLQTARQLGANYPFMIELEKRAQNEISYNSAQ